MKTLAMSATGLVTLIAFYATVAIVVGRGYMHHDTEDLGFYE